MGLGLLDVKYMDIIYVWAYNIDVTDEKGAFMRTAKVMPVGEFKQKCLAVMTDIALHGTEPVEAAWEASEK